MDPEELRESLIEEAKRAAREEEPAEISNMRSRLFNEAKAVAARFRSTGQGAARRKLREIYTRIDLLLQEFDRTASIADEEERYQKNKRLRQKGFDILEALRRIESSEERRREEIEEGRRRVVEKGRAGAGENTHKGIRAELNYLLQNYTPANDYKIETLIDKWRRSGDPQYDPAIKVRYRNVRRKKSDSDHAI